MADTQGMRFRAALFAFGSALLILLASACSGLDEAPAPGATGRALVEPANGPNASAGMETTDATPADESVDAPGAIAFEANADGAQDDAAANAPEDQLDNESSSVKVEPSSSKAGSAEDEGEVSNDPLERLTSELIDFVEQERGLTFTSRPQVNLLDDAAFGTAWRAVIAQDAVENSVDYDNFTDIYRAMGVIDGEQTLEEIWTRFGDAGVIGYYDPATDNITLRSGEITAFTRTVLVHELVHALEDQTFGLDRPEYDDRTDEIDWTFSALSEGSARVIESRYRAEFTAAELAEEDAARRALPRSVSLSEFTTSFLELQLGRYRYGETFVDALWADGQGAIDDAFANPPATSELILDPDAFLGGAAPDAGVNVPPADEASFTSGVWGEAAWAAIFSDTFDRVEALELANGWGGDAYVAWRTSTGTCVRIHVAGDTADELDEYALALEEWATQRAGREIFYPTADIVRVTACG